MNDRWCIQCAQALVATVVSVDYRYAPQHPFPVPLQDSHSALKWVGSQAKDMGIDPARVAIGGASAGGGLAAALAQLAYDREQIKPVFQLLVYPMLDERTSFRTDVAGEIGMSWSLDSNRFGWEAYLGDRGGSPDPPEYAVPARREDLSGLPPAWIGVGTHDLFHDENVAYAQRLKRCGVDCELCIVPGAPHGFDVAVPQSRLAQDFRKSQLANLGRRLFP